MSVVFVDVLYPYVQIIIIIIIVFEAGSMLTRIALILTHGFLDMLPPAIIFGFSFVIIIIFFNFKKIKNNIFTKNKAVNN